LSPRDEAFLDYIITGKYPANEATNECFRTRIFQRIQHLGHNQIPHFIGEGGVDHGVSVIELHVTGFSDVTTGTLNLFFPRRSLNSSSDWYEQMYCYDIEDAYVHS
ncbi:hypothetical protein PMAYCL1PPCAC_25297, partial [Pristionchus mayeri]